MRDLSVLLISTYELGRQPFGLASPAAWLRADGHSVRLLDLSRQPLDEEAVRRADLIGIFLPMHTATRLGVRALAKMRTLNPRAHLCAYGLYAPVNADLLRGLGVATILGGEFEAGLRSLSRRLAAAEGDLTKLPQAEPEISLERQEFLVPDRAGLPPLDKYARLTLPDGSTRVVGYTEASRGCKHRCRHCPIVPVYNGKFRIVGREVVLEDIRRQVAAGAQHITFGDPDFFNGPTHAVEIVQALHREFPDLSYDVTIKVEHLLEQRELLPVLRQTGCAFVTTAVESVDDRVLRMLDKGHSRADFIHLAMLMRALGLFLVPTFVPFTPWTTLESYQELLSTIAKLELIEHVPPVQLAIRLLIPAGSRLLEITDLYGVKLEAFEPALLMYPWRNSDPRVDELQRELEEMVQRESKKGAGRSEIFAQIWKRTQRARGEDFEETVPVMPPAAARVTIPYLTEPWYC
ncbi:MAG: CUAEP/CCAEP-tail radical SAM (seleno)protein [Terriglobales bacterium]